MEVLQIDQYVWSILRSTNDDVDEVTIDALANWKPSTIAYNVKVSHKRPPGANAGTALRGRRENGTAWPLRLVGEIVVDLFRIRDTPRIIYNRYI